MAVASEKDALAAVASHRHMIKYTYIFDADTTACHTKFLPCPFISVTFPDPFPLFPSIGRCKDHFVPGGTFFFASIWVETFSMN